MRRTRDALRKRGEVWHINGKRIKGYGPLYESTGETDRDAAQRYLAHRIKEIRDGLIYGVRPAVPFRDAAAHYLETENKKSLIDEVYWIDHAMEFIGDIAIHLIHDETLRDFVRDCKGKGNKSKTIRLKLGVVRRILNLCATQYRHKETGMTWLSQAPKITMPRWDDAKAPYPLTWEEQRMLFPEFPEHLLTSP